MRYAVFGDIHGNLDALETVLSYLEDQGIDQYICLGDIVGYGARPAECMKRVQDLHADTIAGNHDWAAVEKISIDFFNAYAKAAAVWTRQALDDQQKQWLLDLPLTRSYDHCSIAHGTFHQPEAYNYIQTVFDAHMSFEALKELGSEVGFIGHSHVPVSFFQTDPITYSLDREIPLEEGVPTIVNVGSVGQPRDENPQASFAIFDSDKRVVNIIRLDYDIDSAAQKIRDAGLPEILAERLYQGR